MLRYAVIALVFVSVDIYRKIVKLYLDNDARAGNASAFHYLRNDTYSSLLLVFDI